MNVKMKVKSNTHGIIRLKANDVNLSLNVNNLPLRHASSKVSKGGSYFIFLDNELKSIGSDPSKEGHNDSLIIDMKQGIKWNK